MARQGLLLVVGVPILGGVLWNLLSKERPPIMTNPVDPGPLPDPIEPEPLPSGDSRAQVVAIAMSQVGAQDASKYWEGVGVPAPYPKSWCGGFALWCLHQAGLALDTNWKIGVGFCYKLPMTREPQPGDIAYFDKPYQHHAIVVSVSPDTLTTVDGNQAGETVRVRERSPNSPTAYYSIQPLIDGEESASV